MFYDLQTVSAAIAAGASLSNGIRFGGLTAMTLIVPSGWTAANITFQVSYDGVNYSDFRDIQGAEIGATVIAAGDVIQLDYRTFRGVVYLKVRSGVSATPVNQVSSVSVNFMCKAID